MNTYMYIYMYIYIYIHNKYIYIYIYIYVYICSCTLEFAPVPWSPAPRQLCPRRPQPTSVKGRVCVRAIYIYI